MRSDIVDVHRAVPEKEHPVRRRAGASKTVWVETREERSMSSFSLQRNAESQSFEQNYGNDPLADRESDLYRGEFVTGFVEKWHELIDWEARAKSEGQFFIDVLRARGKTSVPDAATGTGFHSIRLTEAGIDVISVDGSAAVLAKAFENGRKRVLTGDAVAAD
jgi:glycine/sarcosine/dimethylglycine N-methyltransferase